MDTWYQQTVTKLYRFTYALLQNREEAEDITQETYFRCLKKDPENYPPYPYLKQIARNLIYDRYRHLSEGPVKVVYVKRLIRQDQSGIWIVVGFDLR